VYPFGACFALERVHNFKTIAVVTKNRFFFSPSWTQTILVFSYFQQIFFSSAVHLLHRMVLLCNRCIFKRLFALERAWTTWKLPRWSPKVDFEPKKFSFLHVYNKIPLKFCSLISFNESDLQLLYFLMSFRTREGTQPEKYRGDNQKSTFFPG